jgi:hypothetical protein
MLKITNQTNLPLNFSFNENFIKIFQHTNISSKFMMPFSDGSIWKQKCSINLHM